MGKLWLVAGGFVRQASPTLFFVRSIQNFHHDYVVRVDAQAEVSCDCDDYAHRGDCAHAVAVRAVRQHQSWTKQAV